MLSFICKKIRCGSIYDKHGYYKLVTIVNVYSSYILEKFKINNKLYFKLIYFYPYNRKNKIIKQIKTSIFDYNNYELFDNLPLNIFYVNQRVNICAISIGKGFSGTIKKYNFKSNYASHGNSKAHNKSGSIGMCQDPGRVFPGKKMPGRLGGKKKTFLNTKILKIDFENHILYLESHLPGFNDCNLIINSNLKNVI